MVRNKGILHLVEAAKLMRGRGLEFEVHLVGDVDPRNPTTLQREDLQALEESGPVKWLGHRSDVASLLGKADIFCLPSYREGLPRSLVEASAAGLPIVTTDVPGCRDVVVNGLTGYLVPPQDAEALAEALTRLVDSPELRGKMGAEGRKRFEERFSTPSVLQAFMMCHLALGMPIRIAENFPAPCCAGDAK
jgi:glycosyltransferase involved in cell wall biosynthesis